MRYMNDCDIMVNDKCGGWYSDGEW